MENDLIRRGDAVTICCDLFCGHPCPPEERDTCGLVEAVQAHIPAVDAVEVRHGWWRFDDFDGDGLDYTCSCCGLCSVEGYDFCPNCGAHMDGQHREEEHTMRLIDADALIQSVGDKWTDYDIELVDSFPTIDAVPVVRCRECEHWQGPDDGDTHSCSVDAWMRPGWWFCPAGQRREDGDA